MPETDILNPTVDGEMNPDYGYQPKRPITHLSAKPRTGPPRLREVTDVGCTFSLTWTDRPTEVARALKRYYEQYRGGFFTFVDWEGGGIAPGGEPVGRHYVGRFTTFAETSTGFNRWLVQAQFDEVPLAPMVRYPSNWEHDAIWIYAVDDFGAETADTVGNWICDQSAGAAKALSCSDAVNTSWAQIGYLGYGFQLIGHRAANLGMIDIYLDGALVQQGLDLYAANPIPASFRTPLLTQAHVSFGLHRVKLVCSPNKNAASSGNLVYFEALRVMR